MLGVCISGVSAIGEMKAARISNEVHAGRKEGWERGLGIQEEAASLKQLRLPICHTERIFTSQVQNNSISPPTINTFYHKLWVNYNLG